MHHQVLTRHFCYKHVFKGFREFRIMRKIDGPFALYALEKTRTPNTFTHQHKNPAKLLNMYLLVIQNAWGVAPHKQNFVNKIASKGRPIPEMAE